MTDQAKIALVTGGSRGIGARTAVTLARQGWDVAISYRERADVAAGRRRRMPRGTGGARWPCALILLPRPTSRGLFTQVDRELGPLTGLVNNAGIVPSGGEVADYTADRLEKLFAINVTGAFLAAREAVRRMSTGRGGSGGVIVNISSRAAALGGAGEYVDYAASKAAVDAMTIGLAREVAGEGIRVVGVRPGLIATEIHAPGRLERLGSSPPLGRPGDPQEVAKRGLTLLIKGR